MKKYLIIPVFILSLISCNSVKKTQEAINYGNYDQAIETALQHLRSNKAKKSNQPYVLMLEEAFKKSTARDLEKIKFLNKDSNPENLEEIYNLYNILSNRQSKIKPILPLPIYSKHKNALFHFNDYSSDIISSKNTLSAYLYSKSKKALIESKNKLDFRSTFEDLNYLESFNPNYKDVRSLLDQAHQKGLDYIIVSMQNNTDQVIPLRLEEDLLNFESYKLNSLWTIYHNKKLPNQNYDYALAISLRNIQISPEQVHEKVIVQEKQIKDGWQYLIDENGNGVKDSLGNTIKIDKFKTVKSKLTKFSQFKSAQVDGKVQLIDLHSNQTIDTFPIASQFDFNHYYAKYSGDKEAIEKKYLNLLNYKFVPFPSNEQMVYDTGEDLKNKIKIILNRTNFR